MLSLLTNSSTGVGVSTIPLLFGSELLAQGLQWNGSGAACRSALLGTGGALINDDHVCLHWRLVNGWLLRQNAGLETGAGPNFVVRKNVESLLHLPLEVERACQ
jgi:hypothetical protein